MWATVGEVLPYATALALSPLALVTGIILNLGHRGKARALLFGTGWSAAVLIQAGLAFLLVDVAESVDPVATEAGVDVAQLIFGVLFAVLAVVTWRKRDSKGGALLARVGSTGVAGSLGLGLAQGFLMIKNLPLAISAGAAFAEARLGAGSSVAGLLTFAALAGLGVFVPLLLVLVGGPRVLGPSPRRATGWRRT